MKRAPSSGVSWGGQHASTHSWPTVAFLSEGVVPGYLGEIHAISMDMQAGRPITVMRTEGAALPRRTLLVMTPTPVNKDRDAQILLEKSALLSVIGCCLVINQVEQLPTAGCLDQETRKKVRMLVFCGPKSEVVTKAVGILFPNLGEAGLICTPESENAHGVAGQILNLASVI